MRKVEIMCGAHLKVYFANVQVYCSQLPMTKSSLKGNIRLPSKEMFPMQHLDLNIQSKPQIWDFEIRSKVSYFDQNLVSKV